MDKEKGSSRTYKGKEKARSSRDPSTLLQDHRYDLRQGLHRITTEHKSLIYNIHSLMFIPPYKRNLKESDSKIVSFRQAKKQVRTHLKCSKVPPEKLNILWLDKNTL
jgi:hypothetical protein